MSSLALGMNFSASDGEEDWPGARLLPAASSEHLNDGSPSTNSDAATEFSHDAAYGRPRAGEGYAQRVQQTTTPGVAGGACATCACCGGSCGSTSPAAGARRCPGRFAFVSKPRDLAEAFVKSRGAEALQNKPDQEGYEQEYNTKVQGLQADIEQCAVQIKLCLCDALKFEPRRTAEQLHAAYEDCARTRCACRKEACLERKGRAWWTMRFGDESEWLAWNPYVRGATNSIAAEFDRKVKNRRKAAERASKERGYAFNQFAPPPVGCAYEHAACMRACVCLCK